MVSAQVIDRSKLIAFGKELQALGYSVTEMDEFGGVTAGAHLTSGWHYKQTNEGKRGGAIDVNYDGQGQSVETRKLDKAVELGKVRGIQGIIWQSAGHWGHAHFDVGSWQRIRSSTGKDVGPGNGGTTGGGTTGAVIVPAAAGIPTNPITKLVNALEPFNSFAKLLNDPFIKLRVWVTIVGISLIALAFISLYGGPPPTELIKKGMNNVTQS